MTDDPYYDISTMTREGTLDALDGIINGVIGNLAKSGSEDQFLNIRYWHRVKRYLKENLK